MAARKKSAKKTKSTKKSSATKRKVTAKKATAKRTARKAATAKVVAGPLGKVSRVYTKGTLLTTISERTGLGRKEVGTVLNELTTIIEGHIKRGGPGKFTLPGVLKMTVKNVPARKARKGVNPFTGEPTIFKAKPASRKVRIIALKSLKEMAV